jgi:hypothetical protein
MEEDYLEVPPENNFQKRFDKYQALCSTFSRPTTSHPHVSLTDIIEIHHRKTSCTRKKKITPIGKLTSSSTTHSSQDHSIGEKIRERVRQMISKVCETRSWVDKTLLYEKTIEFCGENKTVFPKNKDKIDKLILYCMIMAGRLNGIFFDTHVLSIEFDIKAKDINKTIVENNPPLTSPQFNAIEGIMGIDKMCLHTEYNNILKPVVTSFSSTSVITEEDYKYYERRTRDIFFLLEGDDIEDSDRQFCVTPNKVFIYSIFELIRKINPQTTERSICDYLSTRFQIPRVTIEKMKRLVAKSSRDK